MGSERINLGDTKIVLPEEDIVEEWKTAKKVVDRWIQEKTGQKPYTTKQKLYHRNQLENLIKDIQHQQQQTKTEIDEETKQNIQQLQKLEQLKELQQLQKLEKLDKLATVKEIEDIQELKQQLEEIQTQLKQLNKDKQKKHAEITCNTCDYTWNTRRPIQEMQTIKCPECSITRSVKRYRGTIGNINKNIQKFQILPTDKKQDEKTSTEKIGVSVYCKRCEYSWETRNPLNETNYLRCPECSRQENIEDKTKKQIHLFNIYPIDENSEEDKQQNKNKNKNRNQDENRKQQDTDQKQQQKQTQTQQQKEKMKELLENFGKVKVCSVCGNSWVPTQNTKSKCRDCGNTDSEKLETKTKNNE